MLVNSAERPWLLFFSASPWHEQRHRQHALATHLAATFNILFIDPPTNLGRTTFAPTVVAPGIWQTPHAVSQLGGRYVPAANRANRRETATEIAWWLRGSGATRLLWLDDDLAFEAVGHCGESVVVVDVTDLDWTFTRVWNRWHLKRGLARSVACADVIFTSSHALPVSLPSSAVTPVVVPNGCDPTQFAPIGGAQPEPIERMEPVIGYVGSVDTRAFDAELIEGIAAARPDWNVVLIGPTTRAGRRNLSGLPNVLVLGSIPFEEVPAMVQGFDVGLIPYRITHRTSYVHPKKLFEYMAAGVPVVSTPLEAVREFSPLVTLASTAPEFVAAIERRLTDRAQDREAYRTAAIRVAQENTWADRVEQIIRELAYVSTQGLGVGK